MNPNTVSSLFQSEYLSALLSSIEESIIATDENFHINYWNKGSEKIFGLKASEVMGKGTLDVLKFTYPPGLEQGIQRLLLKNGFWRGQLKYSGKDGRLLLLDISVRTVKNDLGAVMGYVGVHRDITEYDQAKTALNAFLSIISSSEDNFIIVEKDLSIAYIDEKTNKHINDIYGITYQTGENILDKLPASRKKDIEEYINEALADEKTKYEINVTNIYGDSKWLQVRFFPLKDQNGYITHACALIRDITAQKRIDILNDQLYRSRKLFETFMENSPILSWITDAACVIRYLNPSYLRTYRMSRQHIGKLITEVFPPNVAQVFVENTQHVIRTNQTVETTETWQTPDGAEHVYQVLKFPIVSEGELFVGGWAIDITGEIQLRKSLTNSLEQLQQSQEELTAALAKEHHLNELKSRFVSMASHEFRTPLTSMLTSTFLLEKYAGSEQQNIRVKHIQRVRESIHHMNDLLDDFLSLGRIEQGTTVVDIAEVDFKQLVYDALEELDPIKKKGQVVLFNYEGYEILKSDKKLLKVIIVNLINNALKFSPENKQVTISCIHENGAIQMAVQDQGIGISQEDQQHLFESFYRARNAQNIQGTGLGLHIVKRYCELLNGSVALVSEIGEGTTASITLPTG